MPLERCHRCHIILTSEDKYHYSISCHACEEDYWYAEHFDYFPLRCARRFARYQLRWLWSVTGHLGSLLLRGVRRLLGRNRSEWTDGSGR